VARRSNSLKPQPCPNILTEEGRQLDRPTAEAPRRAHQPYISCALDLDPWKPAWPCLDGPDPDKLATYMNLTPCCALLRILHIFTRYRT